ncbi:MAG: helix-turn-helix domain-containing protein [Eubacteriales bacterium]|nr:helix-turn-helix domain-containing protein [Eubacteriales bacterium]
MFKVFLVEDEIVVREGIRKNIQWEQYGFFYAGDAPDGELALPLIRQIRPDLLITDIKMPFMDGLALSELVRKELPETKIVIISGYDDFTFAQQAIRMGVEQYLLKPIIKEKMVELLISLQKKMEAERQQREYLTVFQREAQEYEAFSRRRFFEQIVTGGLSVSEISETAKAMGIDLNAPCYNILLYSLNNAKYDGSAPEGYTDALAAAQEKVTRFFTSRSELLLFRWNITTHAVLIKGEQNGVAECTRDCVENIRRLCTLAGREVNWHIACGSPVSRLSALPACFAEANRILSYRYLCPEEHILSETSIRNIREKNESEPEAEARSVDRERIRCFLSAGTAEEVDRFIDQLLQSAGEEAVSIPVFCKYLTMTVYFAAAEYLDSIGCHTESFWPQELRPTDCISTPDEVRRYIRQVMLHAVELRDNENKKQQRDLLIKAIGYIDQNYSEETISLDKVAHRVNISPNYFSAMFSQEVGQTFVEYLTGKRIAEAKRMLRQTDMRSSEIAFAVGFRDSHYFSFVFKKVTGCTPSEYRKGEKR